MSMVEKLKKYRLIKYLYNKKSKNIFNTDFPNKKLTLKKSNSFNIKTENNDTNNIIPLLTLKSFSKNKEQTKLRNKNTKLKLNLTKMQKDLVLAKSTEHKKLFELKKKERLLNNAINMKKLAIETEDNFINSFSNIYQREKEKEIIEESFKSNLLYKIKKQYSFLEKEHNKKDNEIIKLKNNIKHCKNKELISKNQKLLIDLIEIKDSYDENLLKNNEYKIKMKDYIELEEKLTKKNFCILELKESLNDINYSNINLENDIENLKNKLEKLERENEKLNSQYNILSDRYTKVSNDKREIEKEYAIFFDENNKNDKNINLSNFE